MEFADYYKARYASMGEHHAHSGTFPYTIPFSFSVGLRVFSFMYHTHLGGTWEAGGRNLGGQQEIATKGQASTHSLAYIVPPCPSSNSSSWPAASVASRLRRRHVSLA